MIDECKWMQDEVCVNADCPACADYCPVADTPGVCKYEERGDRDVQKGKRQPVPNNPAKAYELGRLDGTKQCMDNVSCVLLDKLGFHVREETADEHDTRSLEYLQQCLVELVEAKNNGYIKMADIEKALHGEYKMVNSAE